MINTTGLFLILFLFCFIFIILFYLINKYELLNKLFQGTAVTYKPGIIVGGVVEHDCSTQRPIGYYLEGLVSFNFLFLSFPSLKFYLILLLLYLFHLFLFFS